MKTMRFTLAAVALLLAAPLAHAGPGHDHSKHDKAKATSDAKALDRLMQGNERFVTGKWSRPNQDAARRTEVAAGQKPFAIIVSCSDSRVPPEMVFDQGLGDLFVVRTAGHVVDPVAMGSIEFAVAKLGARQILVVGHERCGAVQAALEGATVPGSIGAILSDIKPAVGGPTTATPEALDAAIAKQARAVAQQLRTASPVLTPMIQDGSLQVAAGVYDLDTGKVTALASEGSR
jgi:carbonic anhydrase